jgi:hypothetical protein
MMRTLRNAFAYIALLLLLASPVWGATKYVKTPCTNNGDGSANSCAAAPDGVGAYNSIANAAAGGACGDTINVTDGVYNFNNATFSQSCTAGNELILQWNGWSAVGDIATSAVYFENMNELAGAGWTQCSDCGAGSADTGCRNIPGTCGEAWFHIPSAGKKALWAQTPSGGITPRRASLDLVAAQYDAFSTDGADTILTVRWGGSLPSEPWANGENNQFITQITGDYIIFRGIHFRYNLNSAINITSASDHATVKDCSFKYFNDSGNGSARPVHVDSASNVSITDNEMAYTSSEPLHITTVTDGTVSAVIQRNWVHGIGDLTTLGAGTSGTPNCTTFTSDAPCCSYSTTGDFTGTIVEDNIFDGCGNTVNSSGRKAILFESHCDNLIVRNNIIANSGTCFKWHPSNGGSSNHTDNNQVYNNLCLNPTIGDGLSFQFRQEATGTMAGNLIYNNTVIGAAGGALAADNNAEITGNLIRNNIFYYNGTVKQVQWDATDASNKFEHNHIYITGAGNAATWAGSSYACSALDTLQTGNVDSCPDPVFVNAASNNYHIQTSSPAKDAGTATGMPAGRTADICNSIASAHGYAAYNDCASVSGSVDIGMDEFVAQGGGGSTKKRMLLHVGPRSPLPQESEYDSP